jgi:8-oxo-dGTP pyrophosphatase MutT (NUDIX family)
MRNNKICMNCGEENHVSSKCVHPITSYGIINISFLEENSKNIIFDNFSNNGNDKLCISSKKYPHIKFYLNKHVDNISDNTTYDIMETPLLNYDSQEYMNYYKSKILFMMVSRKHSLGFIEFMKGRYDINDYNKISSLFEQMYQEEINIIMNNVYDDILFQYLRKNNNNKQDFLNKIYEGKFSHEYCDAKIKFNILKYQEMEYNLEYFIKIKPTFDDHEWGFPKGRRSKISEDNIACAMREFEEESGVKNNEYIILNKINPIQENLIGTNGINYKHIYYVASNTSEIRYEFMNFDDFEIGRIRWFTYDEAMMHIRPYHSEKKIIITSLFIFFINFLQQQKK